MIKFSDIKNFFIIPITEYLPMDYCQGKSDKELLNKLKTGRISPASGNMIVLELLERLLNNKNVM